MNDKKYLVFIESNTSGTGELYARLARIYGLTPVLFTMKPEIYTQDLKQEVILKEVNTLSIREITAEAELLSNTGEILGVTSSSEYFIGTAAKLANILELPCNHPDHIESTRNKYLSRQRLLEFGIAIPNFIMVGRQSSIKDACAKIGFPLVVKPVLGSGSQSVRLFHDEHGVEEYCDELLSSRENARGQKIPGYILIEEYVRGEEYSVEAFGDGESVKVVGITKKYTGAYPYFVETGHDFPARLDKTDKQMIIDISHKALKASNLLWGPLHLELMLTPDRQIKIIEINPRLAGGMIPKLIKYASGLDLISEHIHLLTGGPLSLNTGVTEFASIRFLVPPADGNIELINLEEAVNVPGIQEAVIYERLINFERLNGDFRDRLGHLISTGTNFHQNRHQINTALSKVSYKYAG